MLKLVLYIIFGLSSIALLVYAIKSNKSRIKGKILNSIFIPNIHFIPNKSLLIVYPLISNVSKNDNSIIKFEMEIDCGMGFFSIPLCHGMEDGRNPAFYALSRPSGETLVLLDVKLKLLYKDSLNILSGHTRHGYLFFALEKGFFFENILKYKLIVTDVSFNKFEIHSDNPVNDTLLFLQKSNAKIYKANELHLMAEILKKYYGI